ncbi:MAG: hypothetical protein M1355_04070 [Patescibacteria group bacterium]|nr:hypothetical protein [Patescibacteria group bacterium]
MVKTLSIKEKPSEGLFNPQKTIEEIFGLGTIKDREEIILKERYGLFGESPKTLDFIGKKYGITRERVRQIEKNALKKLSNNKKSKEYIDEINKIVNKHFEINGHIILDIETENIAKNTRGYKNEVNFLLNLNNELKYFNENKAHLGIWTKKEINYEEIIKIIEGVVSELEKRNEPLHENEAISLFESKAFSEKFLKNVFKVSKKLIKIGEFYGLTSNRVLNPKSIKDKILIILNESKKPLHYSEITLHLNNNYAPKKKVTHQSVHNELIKNKEFILVGRGIYALKDWGYKKGTVEEVIREILIEEGKPLHKKEIIKKVKDKRIVKDTTIILNLQRFKRVGKAVYTVG